MASSTSKPAVASKPKMLGIFTLAMINIAAVVSLRGMPAEAEYGMASAFYYIFAAICFLIPVSLVAAELATLFSDKQGGLFRWVGEAFGKKAGFLAIWLQWTESTIWYPTVLTFGAVSLAFIGMDQASDSALASNKIFTAVVVLGIYWLATFISLKGMSWVGKVTKVGAIVGTVIPAALLVVLAVIYLALGGHSYLDFHSSFLPDLSKFDNIVLACSIFLFFAGMEMSALHVKQIENPNRNYPKAIFISALITVLIFVLGTYAVSIIIPKQDINLVQSLLVGFDNYFKVFHISWLGPVIAICLAFGVLAGVLSWVSGPSQGIFAVGKAGYLPPFFQKANKNGIQRNILMLQGLLVTCLAMMFVVMPSVQSFYQILSQLTVLLYLIAYLLMFAAAIYLRYNMPKATRAFRLGNKGNWLMWLVAGVGFIGSLAAFILSFLPPAQIATGSSSSWVTMLVVGVIIFVAAPFIILMFQKPSWKDPESDFEPFHWEADQVEPTVSGYADDIRARIDKDMAALQDIETDLKDVDAEAGKVMNYAASTSGATPAEKAVKADVEKLQADERRAALEEQSRGKAAPASDSDPKPDADN